MPLKTKTLQANGSRGHHRFTLNVYEDSTNTSTNKSQMSYNLTISPIQNGWDWSGWGQSISFSGTIGSKTFNGYIPNYNGSSTITLSSGNWEEEHNSNGSKTINISFNITDNTGQTYTCGNASKSDTLALTDIPRASDVACNSPYIGDVATITINRKLDLYVDTVTYEIGTGSNKLTGTIATKTSETVLSLQTSEIENSIYALIPNAREISGKVFCTTYNGNTQIGSTKSSNFNLYAKESVCKPSISAVAIDTNSITKAITGSNTKFIKYMSKPKVTITATAKKSATISNYLINMNDGQTSTLREKTFDSIESNIISTSAKDTREYTSNYDINLSSKMYDYIKLHVNNISISRSEGTSNTAILNCDGVYFNGSFGNAANTLSARFQYRETGTEQWTNGGTITPTKTNNTFKFNNYSLGNLFNFNKEYQFKFIFEDLLMTVGNSNSDIQTLEVGQEVVSIGDGEVYVYGNMYLNDKLIPYFTTEETWSE